MLAGAPKEGAAPAQKGLRMSFGREYGGRGRPKPDVIVVRPSFIPSPPFLFDRVFTVLYLNTGGEIVKRLGNTSPHHPGRGYERKYYSPAAHRNSGFFLGFHSQTPRTWRDPWRIGFGPQFRKVDCRTTATHRAENRCFAPPTPQEFELHR